jgi:hypothetical protein
MIYLQNTVKFRERKDENLYFLSFHPLITPMKEIKDVYKMRFGEIT